MYCCSISFNLRLINLQRTEELYRMANQGPLQYQFPKVDIAVQTEAEDLAPKKDASSSTSGLGKFAQEMNKSTILRVLSWIMEVCMTWCYKGELY